MHLKMDAMLRSFFLELEKVYTCIGAASIVNSDIRMEISYSLPFMAYIWFVISFMPRIEIMEEGATCVNLI